MEIFYRQCFIKAFIIKKKCFGIGFRGNYTFQDKRKDEIMTYFADSNVQLENGGVILDEKNGCVNGCKVGISVYGNIEYNKGGVHEDQEGFYVLEGTGKALFGDEEHEIHPGMTMIAPAGVKHQIKKDEGSCDVKVLYFHAM